MCPFVLAQRTAGSWRPWKPWHSTRTSWLQLCHRTRALRGNTRAFSTSGYSWSPRLQELLRYPLLCFVSHPWIICMWFPLARGKWPEGIPGWRGAHHPSHKVARAVNQLQATEETPLLGCSPQLCPTHILMQTKPFLKSGDSQQDLSTSAPIFYPFGHLLVQLCYLAVRNSFPKSPPVARFPADSFYTW